MRLLDKNSVEFKLNDIVHYGSYSIFQIDNVLVKYASGYIFVEQQIVLETDSEFVKFETVSKASEPEAIQYLLEK